MCTRATLINISVHAIAMKIGGGVHETSMAINREFRNRKKRNLPYAIAMLRFLSVLEYLVSPVGFCHAAVAKKTVFPPCPPRLRSA